VAPPRFDILAEVVDRKPNLLKQVERISSRIMPDGDTVRRTGLQQAAEKLRFKIAPRDAGAGGQIELTLDRTPIQILKFQGPLCTRGS
jgi:hypothetical protein